jgi:hypothetical protein
VSSVGYHITKNFVFIQVHLLLLGKCAGYAYEKCIHNFGEETSVNVRLDVREGYQKRTLRWILVRHVVRRHNFGTCLEEMMKTTNSVLSDGRKFLNKVTPFPSWVNMLKGNCSASDEHEENSQNYWVFGVFPSSGILDNTTFRKLDLFPKRRVL